MRAVLLLVLGLAFPYGIQFNAMAMAQTPPSNSRPFIVFDGTLYHNKPDFSAYKIQPINIVYGQEFGNDYFKQPDTLPNESNIERVAISANIENIPAVLDIEHWALQLGALEAVKSTQKYLAVLRQWKTHSVVPTGYYGNIPLRDYWRAIKGESHPDYLAWQAANDRVQVLADYVDVLYPSLYTFYVDQVGWKTYATENIKEARRIAKGKPVYAFIWPQYHPSDPKMAYNWISKDYWRMQLDTLAEIADGIVIWGGWDFDNNRKAEWDNDAPWWKATKEFILTLEAKALMDVKSPTAPMGIKVH